MPPHTRNNTQTITHPAGQGEQRDVAPELPNGTHPHQLIHALPEANRPHQNQVASATITIATLNVNGFTAPSHNMTGKEKWSTIYRAMSDQRIAILAIQETHLDDELLSQVNQCYSK